MVEGVRSMLMRGGTSKGLYFLAGDLPADEDERDDLLLRIMGSPDARQIDGIGGSHPLTSKVAVIRPSDDEEADVDYHFLQVSVDEALVSDAQNCGNILAGVAPFAIERGLIERPDGPVAVRIRMVNTGGIVTAGLNLAETRPNLPLRHRMPIFPQAHGGGIESLRVDPQAVDVVETTLRAQRRSVAHHLEVSSGCDVACNGATHGAAVGTHLGE